MSSSEEILGYWQTLCSPVKFREVVDNLTEEQRECVEDMGFGVLMNMSCLQLFGSLCNMLLTVIQPGTQSVVLHGKWIPIRVSDFSKVMGLADGIDEVNCDSEEFDETCIRMKALLQSSTVKDKITLSSLQKKLQSMRAADDDFKISFALFTISILLCPPASPNVDESLLTQLKNPKLIRHKKWATFSFQYLMDGVRNIRNRGTTFFQGCLPFLQIFYWGCLSQNKVYVNRLNVPLVAWTKNKAEAVNRLVDNDDVIGGYYSSTVEVDEPYWSVMHRGLEQRIETMTENLDSIGVSLDYFKKVEVPDMVRRMVEPLLESFKLEILKLLPNKELRAEHVHCNDMVWLLTNFFKV